jgi:hypothetical protein
MNGTSSIMHANEWAWHRKSCDMHVLHVYLLLVGKDWLHALSVGLKNWIKIMEKRYEYTRVECEINKNQGKLSSIITY